MERKSQTTGPLSPAKANCRSSSSLVVLSLEIILWWKLNLNIKLTLGHLQQDQMARCPLQLHEHQFDWGRGPRRGGRVRQPGKPVRYHYKYIWNNALFDLECKLTCIVNCIDTTCGTTRNYFLGLKHSIPGDSWSSRGLSKILSVSVC